ncbi:MAG: adenylyl-sulfate kinase [Limnobacter sp.]|nr:adenylyl-sulfate kinase [Limnobacter sp.]
MDKSSLLDTVQSTRWNLMGHMPAVVWISGLACSGKSTLALHLESRLLGMGIHAMTVDEESLDPRFDETLAQRMMLDKASLLFEAGLVAIVAMATTQQSDRAKARVRFPQGLFHEVFLDVPRLICEERDLRGAYSQNTKQVQPLRRVAGLRAPYEPHTNPELVLDCVELDVHACVEEVVKLLTDGGCLDRRYFARVINDKKGLPEEAAT